MHNHLQKRRHNKLPRLQRPCQGCLFTLVGQMITTTGNSSSNNNHNHGNNNNNHEDDKHNNGSSTNNKQHLTSTSTSTTRTRTRTRITKTTTTTTIKILYGTTPFNLAGVRLPSALLVFFISYADYVIS